jgi:4-amino-4-deoxy-L-arabinose transferase-like glycosyltransferase
VPAAVTQQLLGRHIVAIRLVSVAAGVLAVLFTYLAGRELFSPLVGLLAAAFLATLPYHLHFSRLGVNNIADSALAALTVWLLAVALRKQDRRWYYAAGAAAGLSLYPYAGTRLVLILCAALLLAVMVRRRGNIAAFWRQLAAFGIGVLISAAPQAAYFARHPDIFWGRFAQEGILFNGWLGRQAIATGQSVAAILLDQFTRTTLVFVASPAPGNFFDSPYPYLTVVGSVLFLLGMGYALVRPLARPHFTLLLWFWAVVVFGGVLTLNPPANTRLLMTTPALALFMGLGAQKTLDYLRRHGPDAARVGVALVVGLTLVISFQHVSFYLFEYRVRSYFEDPNGEFAMHVGLIAQAAGPDLAIYVLGAPRVYSGFPTIAYLAPENARHDLQASDLEALSLAPGERAGFFATPDQGDALAAIQRRYPGGTARVVERPARPGETLLEYYVVGP